MYNINMSALPYQHIPVMAREVTEYLDPAAGKTIVDCTLGGGGHAAELVTRNPKLAVIGFDQDQEAIAAAKERLKPYSGIKYVNDNFVNLKKHVTEKVDGFLFDLGVSSYQIDAAARGFSLQHDGPLDMRMDQGQKLSATDIVNTWPPQELERIFREYGEERFAGRIARAIVRTRENKGQELKTTFQLKEIVARAIPTWKKRESVTRVFQALRIAVNNELDNLQIALKDAVALLKPGGRIVVIAYHSLEDRIVKNTFRGRQGMVY